MAQTEGGIVRARHGETRGIVWGQLSIVSPWVSDRSNGSQEPWSLVGASDHPALTVLEILQQDLSAGMNWSPRLSGTVTKLGEGA